MAEPPAAAAFSTTITLAPRSAAQPAADMPAMPPPTTSRSQSMLCSSTMSSELRFDLKHHGTGLAGHGKHLSGAAGLVDTKRRIAAVGEIAADHRKCPAIVHRGDPCARVEDR